MIARTGIPTLLISSLIGLLSGILPVHAVVPEQCIELKKRVSACPHQLYRADKLPSQNSVTILCICVTDFQPLLIHATGEQQKIEQNMTRRQFEVEFGQDLPTILAILKRQR